MEIAIHWLRAVFRFRRKLCNNQIDISAFSIRHLDAILKRQITVLDMTFKLPFKCFRSVRFIYSTYCYIFLILVFYIATVIQ